MLLDRSKVVAVIPARAGSKGLPNKNMLACGGQTLVARAVRLAVGMKFDTIVTTDSMWIAERSIQLGAKAILTSDGRLHSDECSSWEVWDHAWDKERYEVSVFLEPTSPMREPEDIRECLRHIPEHSSVLTVSETYPKEKLFHLEKKVVQIEAKRRQDCLPTYRVNGLCYAMHKDHQGAITEKAFPVITSRPVVNIDTFEDLRYADWLISEASQGQPESRLPAQEERT